ncbi:CSC1-like protein ERD4 isoform X1 [Spinacia oleracea]|uniref:CSC1-like protein ERD4 isoform X1 n=2 Tax=Spinacia oleracea TaxID=3562 RepID=A0A9R0JYQ4_SPIOL|nr:CSC1-like protein ERD4 isoform X1 [Spinacia oleracea]
MDLRSFLTSFGTSFLIFVVLMFLFTWLSRKPGNEVIYYPNRIIKGMDPSTKTRNPMSWIKEAISSSEDDIISVSGVDTAVYFVFLSTAFTLFVLAGIVLLPTLLPIAATDHSIRLKNSTTISNGTFTEFDKYSMEHIGPGSWRLWAYMIAVYWISLVTYLLLWRAYKHVSEIRATALMSAEPRAEQFAVLVRDIPPSPEGEIKKEEVDSYFRAIYPDTFYKSMIVTDNKEVNKIWKKLEGYRKKLVRAETIYAQSRTIGSPEGIRPTNRIGLLFSNKVDTIEYYNEKINELTPMLETEQKITLRDRQLPAALVFFSSRVAAASAAQSLHARMVDTWIVVDAPEPRQLIWSNLSINYFSRVIRQYVVYTIVAVSIIFFMIPISLISAFSTFENLGMLLPFLKPVIQIISIRTVLEAYLPQLVLIIFLVILPKLLMFLSKAEGIPSESHAMRAASGKYFYFTVLNVFIGVTLGSSLYSSIKSLEGKPKLLSAIVDLLAEKIPYSAIFFLTFVALRFFVGFGLELSRLVPFIMFHINRKFMCKTEAEVKEAWAPGDLGFETRVPGDMLILTITLCYSVIAPLIIPFGAIYFGLGWVVMRNQALKVYVPSCESYGRMWPHIHTRFLSALIFYQVIMLGYFGIKRFFHATFAIVPLLLVSVIFAFVCNKKFYRFFQHTALDVVCNELKETPDIERAYRSFIPPSLNFDKDKLDGDDQNGEDGDHYGQV